MHGWPTSPPMANSLPPSTATPGPSGCPRSRVLGRVAHSLSTILTEEGHLAHGS